MEREFARGKLIVGHIIIVGILAIIGILLGYKLGHPEEKADSLPARDLSRDENSDDVYRFGPPARRDEQAVMKRVWVEKDIRVSGGGLWVGVGGQMGRVR